MANGPSRPVRVRVIRGKAELLTGMHIVKKLGAAVCFGIDRFNVGQFEWERMAFNGKRHWVFPLVPTASDYAKLGGYIGELQKSAIEGLQMMGGIWGGIRRL